MTEGWEKAASVIAVFAPKILLAFMNDSIWASIVGGGDVGVDVDVYVTA
jgi:hypothetical protein